LNRNILVEADFPELYLESASDDPNRPTPDDYFTRLLKYVPVEIIGGYLIIAGVLESAYPSWGDARRVWLGALLVAGAVGSFFYAQRVNHVRRYTQLAMTSVAFTIWVFASGGVFAGAGWWHPWMGTIAVVVFGLLVRIVGLGPLPPAAPEAP
jgi:hypothetical protein